ncbi:GlsB/YeaQ/YmgE family stress response membrane protein [Halobacillus amylolyticus]|uniref:GlsB/YeaQ/YmgE family stress response membrane protein n=1 Tax=Halobacillus amylolyticus TaxID=2932259 RepID=A0ABY4HAC0_9BACI|nr:GlsB/YeaQ/YmgE family stress response membrane protein [Halobacillus amylolyticus]UOR11612.1 GlsB/YeaQ/YmgE family stress response membrane protein [Halobacillus amylolyticus]
MGLIVYLIVGGILGWSAKFIIGENMPGGIIGKIIAGIGGAWIGGELLGTFGPSVAGIAIIPALIGAIIFIFILSLIMRSTRK